jgi:DNA-binding CsgD family transcriptional regulator
MREHSWINSPSRAILVAMAREGASSREISAATGYGLYTVSSLLTLARSLGVQVSCRKRRSAFVWRVRRLRDKGVPYEEIAARLGISRSSVYRLCPAGGK